MYSFDYQAVFDDAERAGTEEKKVRHEAKYGYFKRPLEQRLQRPTNTAQ